MVRQAGEAEGEGKVDGFAIMSGLVQVEAWLVAMPYQEYVLFKKVQCSGVSGIKLTEIRI